VRRCPLDGENLIGDPTEGALIVLLRKAASVWKAPPALSARGRGAFDSDYKFMATFTT